MQHGARPFHDTQHEDGEHEPDVEEADSGDNAQSAGEAKGDLECHVPEDDGELLVGKGEGPETEIRGSVRDAVEAEFWTHLLIDGISK